MAIVDALNRAESRLLPALSTLARIAAAFGTFLGLVVGVPAGVFVSPDTGVAVGLGMACLGACFIAFISVPAALVMALFGDRLTPAAPAESLRAGVGTLCYAWFARSGILFLTRTSLTFEPLRVLRRKARIDIPLASIMAIVPGRSWWLRRGITIITTDGCTRFLAVHRSWQVAIEAAQRGEPVQDGWVPPGNPTTWRAAGILGGIAAPLGVVLAVVQPALGLLVSATGFLLSFAKMQPGAVVFAGMCLGVCVVVAIPSMNLATADASLTIDAFYREHDRLPDAVAAANAIAEREPRVRYQQLSPGEYSLRTPGRDDQFDTADDIVSTHAVWRLRK